MNTDTSLATAQANVKAAAIAQCTLLNASLTTIYLTAFNNWKISVDAGRIDNSNPPKPPKSYVVTEAPIDAEGLGGPGWFFPEQDGPPVCDMPPIPENMLAPKPPLDGSVTNIGASIGGGFYSCPPSDTNPVGTKKNVWFPDGAIHKFVLIGNPWGRIWEDTGILIG